MQLIDDIGYRIPKDAPMYKIFPKEPTLYHIDCRDETGDLNWFTHIVNKISQCECRGCGKTWEVPYKNLVMLAKMRDFRK